MNALYFSTNGENWDNQTGWTGEKHPCGSESTDPWYGIVCDNSKERIFRVDLKENNLDGQMPSEIRGLFDLREYCHVSPQEST